MIAFPNGKINIGLHITGKRADGYHELQTVFYPVAIHDALEVIPYRAGEDSVFSGSGIPIEGELENNLCTKAYRLLKNDFPNIPNIMLHLHKCIPMGAGLGGGSADASFTLLLLNKQFSLGLSQQQLMHYAMALGSDCPFFMLNKAAFATGRGEALREIGLDLSEYKILLIHTGVMINTRWAFSLITPRAGRDLDKAISLPIASWRECISNDFETPVFTHHPSLALVKESIYNTGAVYASMSGSGSSFYGIFHKTFAGEINLPAHCFYKWV